MIMVSNPPPVGHLTSQIPNINHHISRFQVSGVRCQETGESGERQIVKSLIRQIVETVEFVKFERSRLKAAPTGEFLSSDL